MENIKRLVKTRYEALINSSKDFEAIFNVSFSDESKVLSEKNDGFRIFKTTYGDSKRRIQQIAYSLNKIYPDLKDEFIGISIDSSQEWIDAYWGILASGNKPYLINHRYPTELTNKILARLGAKYSLSYKHSFGYVTEEIDIRNLAEEVPGDYVFEWANEIAISTSATTLKEKIVFYKGQELADNVLNVNYILKLNKRAKKHYKGSLKLLVFLPLYHIFGLVAVMTWFSLFSRTFVFLRDYSAKTILKTVKKHGVTHIFAVPLFWHTLDKELRKTVAKMGKRTEKTFNNAVGMTSKFQKNGKNIDYSRRLLKKVTNQLFGPSVYFCITGGSYIKDETLRLINALGYPLLNGYGMTEVSITSVVLSNKFADRISGSVGKPLPSVQYSIADDGELLIKGESISHKIMINGEIQEPSEWFKTNDIARIDEDGNYYILGRKDDLYIGENGENISPDDIEKNLNITAQRYCILNLNNKLTLIVQASKYASNDALSSLHKSVLEEISKLDQSNRPSEILYTRDDIANANSIKVSRQGLLRLIENGQVSFIDINSMDSSASFEVNQAILEKVTSIVEEFTSVRPIEAKSHFMVDLGCSSLDYFTLVSRLNIEFGISMPYLDDYDSYTIQGMAKIVEELLA